MFLTHPLRKSQQRPYWTQSLHLHNSYQIQEDFRCSIVAQNQSQLCPPADFQISFIRIRARLITRLNNNLNRVKASWHADELFPVLSPVHGLVALGGLVGEDGEGGGQEGADSASHSHPVGASHLSHNIVGVVIDYYDVVVVVGGDSLLVSISHQSGVGWVH